MRFSDHVQEVRSSCDAIWVAANPDADEGSVGLVWLRDDERVVEAARVDPIVERFAELELLSARPGVGRWAKHTPFARTVGDRYRRQLVRMDDDGLERICFAVRHTVAVGYWVALDAHANSGPVNVADDRTLEAIWNFWVVRLTNDFLEGAFGKEQITAATMLGADDWALGSRWAGLRSHGGPGGLGTRGLGWFYGRAGAVLRIAQSEQVDSEFYGRGMGDLVNPWPYSAVAGD